MTKGLIILSTIFMLTGCSGYEDGFKDGYDDGHTPLRVKQIDAS